MKALTNHRVVGMEVNMSGVIREALTSRTGLVTEPRRGFADRRAAVGVRALLDGIEPQQMAFKYDRGDVSGGFGPFWPDLRSGGSHTLTREPRRQPRRGLATEP